MKNLIMTGVFACALCAGVFAEEDIKGEASHPAGQTVVFEEAGGAGAKTIDSGPSRSTSYPNDGGVNDSGAMPPYESYDPNTGLENVVPSDSSGEFDE
jgi:hypothetical protein